MVSDPVAVATIAAIGGVLTAYITNVIAKKVQHKKAISKPKDRMEQMFDGYERLIKQKDIEDERKAKLIAYLEQEIDEARQSIRRLETDLEMSKRELANSELEKQELRDAFEELRKEYRRTKTA